MIALNELSDAPHNDFLRLFTSRRSVRKQTSEELRQQIIASATPEARLAGLAPEKRLAGMTDDEMAALLKQIEALLRRQHAAQPGSRKQSRCQHLPATT